MVLNILILQGDVLQKNKWKDDKVVAFSRIFPTLTTVSPCI